MSKRVAYSTLMLVLLVVSLASLVLPLVSYIVPVVHAARGNPKLAAVQCDFTVTPPSCTNIKLADYNVSIKAGSITVEKVDNDTTYAGWYFAIVFAINSTPLVTFDGAWFDLYISKDGYSALSPDDVKYAGPFTVLDLFGPSLKNVTINNPVLRGGKAVFYIGTITIGTTSYSLVIGPVPFDITADYKYIKVFDGTASQVAVTREVLEILGSIELTPTEGSGGSTVTLRGTALKPNALVNITCTYPDGTSEIIGQTYTDDKGRFSYTWRIKDLKLGWAWVGTIPSDTITITVLYNATGEVVGSVSYTEYRRAFVELRSIKANDVELPFTSLYAGAGNNTLIVNAYVYDTIVLAGAWWNPADTVKIYVGGKLIATATPNETHGFFNVSFTVPELPIGVNTATVVQEGVKVWYIFYINVLPTLLLVPDKGPVGTLVTAYAYGFPVNSTIRIWWYGCKGRTNIVNGTTGPDGRFNVTVTFKVPVDYGGDHTVEATDVTGVTIATATFTVTPSAEVKPSQIVNDGTLFTVTVYGLVPGTLYHVLVDNQEAYEWASCDGCGVLNVTLVAAGFRPGLHVVSIYKADLEGNVTPDAIALFTVLCTGDTECEYLRTILGTVAAIQGDTLVIKTLLGEVSAKISKLEPVITSINGTVVTILTRIGIIEANLSDIKNLLESTNAVITEIRNGIATIATDVGTIKADVAALKSLVESMNATLVDVKSGIAVIRTDVGDIKARLAALEPVITSINGTVATISTTLGTISTDVSTIKKLVESVNAVITEIKDGVATIKTDVGTIKAKLVALEPVITSINGTVVTILTRIGIIEANLSDIKNLLESTNAVITEIRNGIATIATDVGTIKADVAALKSLVESMNATLVDVKSGIAVIRTDVGDIKARLAALEPVITSINGTVATISTTLGTISANVSTIRSLVESANAIITEIRGSIATIKTDVGTIKADVAAIKPNITSISGDVATIKTDIGTVKADVAALKPTVTDIKNGVATVSTTLGEIRGIVVEVRDKVATVATDVGTIKADVSSVKADVGSVKADVADIKGRVPTVQSDVAAVKGDVSTIKESTGTIPTLSTAVWLAVVFSIISAALAAFAVVSVRRKIAG